MTDFSDFLKKRRAIRDYEDKDVPLDILKEILRESCLAPSALNGQPWRFIKGDQWRDQTSTWIWTPFTPL